MSNARVMPTAHPYSDSCGIRCSVYENGESDGNVDDKNRDMKAMAAVNRAGVFRQLYVMRIIMKCECVVMGRNLPVENEGFGAV